MGSEDDKNTASTGFALLKEDGQIQERKNFIKTLGAHGIEIDVFQSYLPKQFDYDPKKLFDFVQDHQAYNWIRETEIGFPSLQFKSIYLSDDESLLIVNSRKRSLTDELQERENVKQAIDKSGHSIYITDTEGIITYANPKTELQSGYEAEELLGRKTNIFQSGLHDEEYYQKLWSTILSGEVWHSEVINRKSNDELYVVDQTIAPVTNEQGDIESFIAVNREITERWFEREKLKEKAGPSESDFQHNQREFLEQISERISTYDYKLGALFIVSIDNYEQLQNALRPLMISVIFETVLKRTESIADSEETFSHINENELAFFSPNITGAERAEEHAKTISDKLNKNIEIDTNQYPLEVSVGYTVEELKSQDTETLLDHAHLANISAKDTPAVDCQMYLSEQYRNVRSKAQAEIDQVNRLKQGIRQKEFEAFFQPILELENRSLTGLEALARWRHPDRGILAPHNFLELARSRNILDKVERQVLVDSIEMMDVLRKENLNGIGLHIILEPQNFLSDAFLKEFSKKVDNAPLEPSKIHLEIVESTLLQKDRALSNLNILKEQGFNVSIDDFGTGYSALNYLVDIPADTVKIDRSLIKNLSEDNPNSPVLFAAVKMVQNLDMRIIAEGIDSEYQHYHLKELGCGFGQGYLYSEPMDLEKTVQYAKSKNYATEQDR